MTYASTPDAPYGIDPESGLPYSEKSKLVAGLLQIFLGGFGAGRFYMGNIGLGLAQLFLGIFTCYLWALIDGILILVKGAKDSDGRPLRP